MNWHGRYLLDRPKVPLSIWPLVLEKVNDNDRVQDKVSILYGLLKGPVWTGRTSYWEKRRLKIGSSNTTKSILYCSWKGRINGQTLFSQSFFERKIDVDAHGRRLLGAIVIIKFGFYACISLGPYFFFTHFQKTWEILYRHMSSAIMLDLDVSPIQGQTAFAVLDLQGRVVKTSGNFPEQDVRLLFQMLLESTNLVVEKQDGGFRRLTISLASSRYLVSLDESHIYLVHTRI